MSNDITTSAIENMSKDDLLSEETLVQIFDIEDEIIKTRLLIAIRTRAKELKCLKVTEDLINAYKAEDVKRKIVYNSINLNIHLEYDKKGDIKNSPTNFENIIRNDEHFKGLRHNLLSHSPEKEIDGIIKQWDDYDDKDAMSYIYKQYGIHNPAMCLNAIALISKEKEYHPIKDKINAIKWDGISRIQNFLIDILNCEDKPYTREVSRLIFAGGIHRIYNPGCKFDNVPVLIGKQGTGKSTIISWLALEEKFYADIYTIDGKEGFENLSGKWMCELSELVALKRNQNNEAIKSFLSRQTDHFRRAYMAHTNDYPRQCIFIGTTNNEQFLTDKTGNRRFFPIKVNSDGYELNRAAKTIKEYILQCWAEAKVLFDNGELHPYPNPDLTKEICSEQSAALEDDYRVGIIRDYVSDKNEVCILQIWRDALKEINNKPSRKDSNEITEILNGLDDWERQTKVKRFYDYGVQNWWKRKTEENTNDFDDLDF